MAKEAEAHSAEDKAKKEEIEARNQLDGMVYGIEKMLKDNADKISGAEKENVEAALAEAKKALEGTDAAAMNAAREKLTQASHKLAEAMYKNAAPQGGAQPGAAPGGDGAAGAQEKKDEGVIDAEYVDVEEKKQ